MLGGALLGLLLGMTGGALRLGAPLVMLGLGGMTLGLAGYAAFRVLDPLLRPEPRDEDGRDDPGRLRDLEREKQAVLKAIKEIELDHQMRKISDADHRELIARYRARALRIIAELEAGDDYRALIEQELKARLGKGGGGAALLLLGAAALLHGLGAGTAHAQPPDLRTMAGRPLPVSDLPVGAVVVRVVRQRPDRPAAEVPVRAQVAAPDGEPETRTATTGDDGRASFEGLVPGARVRAEATVDGERLVSSTFLVPRSGGVRVMLIAGIGAEPPAEDETPVDPEARGSRFEISAMVGRVDDAPELPDGLLEIHVTGEDGKPKRAFPVRLGQVSSDGGVKAFEATTDEHGVARLTGLPHDAHTAYAAVAELGGLRVGSRPFRMPERGGARAFLAPLAVTADPSALRTLSPTYAVIEFREGGLVMQWSLSIENQGEKLFEPTGAGLRFALPEGTAQAQAMPGGTPLELDPGKALVLRERIPPATPGAQARPGAQVRYAFVLPTESDEQLVVSQTLPVALRDGLLLVPEGKHKLEVRGAERYLDSQRMDTGTVVHRYKLPDLAAGRPLVLTVSGFPVQRRTGHRVTAVVVGLLLLAGVAGAVRGRGADARTRGQRELLESKRERLLDELVVLERQRRSGRDDPALRDRRSETVGRLEAVYRDLAALERGAAPPAATAQPDAPGPRSA